LYKVAFHALPSRLFGTQLTATSHSFPKVFLQIKPTTYILSLFTVSIMKSTFFALAAVTAAGSASAAATAYGQCGGQGFSGETACVSGYKCEKSNDWYSQCVPGSAAAAPTKASATKAASTKAASTKAASSAAATKATSSPVKASSAAASPTTAVKASTGGVQYAGVNVCRLPKRLFRSNTNTSHRSLVSTSVAVPTVLAPPATSSTLAKPASTR
jgi:hypothetical protein